MINYRISNEAQEYLIQIYQYCISQFGATQAELYFDAFFEQFSVIANNAFAFESVHHIKHGYRPCPYGSDTIYFRIQDDLVEIMAIIGRLDFQE